MRSLAAAPPPPGRPDGPSAGARHRSLRTAGLPVLVAALASLLVASCGDPGSAPEFMSLGTGGTGGIYYPLGGAIAAELSATDERRTWTAEVTGGSVENINRVASGEIDLGFAIGATARSAWRGTGDWDRPLEELRAVAPLYPNVAHVLARSGLDLTSLAGAEGLRISVGSAGSGTEQFARQLLAAYGLDYDDVDERYLSFTESSSALRDRAIDLAILSVGYPASAALEAISNGGVRLLPVEGPARRRLIETDDVLRPGTIPAGTYPGQEAAVESVAMTNWIVGSVELPAPVVTGLLQILDERRAALIEVNEIARQIDLSALDDAPIPVHPAAGAWWRTRRQAS